MTDNPVVVLVVLILGGIVGVWAFFRFPLPTLLVNYPGLIVSNAVKFIPALAVFMSGQTTIQSEPVKRPDDHIQATAANAQDDMLEASNIFEAVAVSANPVQVFAADDVRVADKERASVLYQTYTLQATPQPPPSDDPSQPAQ
jgi:hypothetical protein